MTDRPTPIQPVENPILCSPYQEPDQHWLYDSKTGIPSGRGAAAVPAGVAHRPGLPCKNYGKNSRSNFYYSGAQLFMTKAIERVIVDHAGGLHEGITDGRTDEAETQALQLFAHGVRFRRAGRNFRQ